jgi:CRISPR-associated protein Cas2
LSVSELERLNQYQILWIFVFFDLPTETKQDRKNYAQFRKNLQKDGFTMMQYSIYVRHSSSRENADVHIMHIPVILTPYSGILTPLQ